MIRILTAAAIAAAFVAGPAAAQTLRISTVGKSAEQVQTEIRAAARQACADAFANIPTPLELQSACRRDVERKAETQLKAC